MVEYDIAAGDLGYFLDPTVSFGPPVCYAGHLMTTSNVGIELLDIPAPGTGVFFVVQYLDTARRGYGTENWQTRREGGRQRRRAQRPGLMDR